VDIELEPDAPCRQHCGNCHRCIDACPTEALEEEGFRGGLCLSYLTIENRGDIPEEAAQKMGETFYGCDRCQQVCPWNAKAKPTAEPLLQPTSELLSMKDEDWQQLSVEQYRKLFKGSAVKRAKYEGLMRNIKAIRNEQDQ
jgi:epoxyqueuosine reductase